MNHNKTPDMGMSIYMNGCGCSHLWNEIRQPETPDNENNGDCRPPCNFEGWQTAMAYVPMQPWEAPFNPEQALKAGTIFPNLRLPFKGGAR